MVNPGDSVLLESPMYAGVIPMFTNLGCDAHEVETDAEGISSTSLRQILESWPEGKPKPKVLYTVPVRRFLFIKRSTILIGSVVRLQPDWNDCGPESQKRGS